MPDRLRSLAAVYDYAGSADPLPTFDIRPEPSSILDFFAGEEEDPQTRTGLRDDESVCQDELTSTWRSLRTGGRPQTIMHSLILRDNLGASRLAAVLGQDVTQVEQRAEALLRRGIIGARRDPDDPAYLEYFLPGIADR